MWTPPLAALVACIALAPAPSTKGWDSPPQERAEALTRALSQLGAGSFEEREAAERWLGLELAAGDVDAVVRAVRSGDSEVGRRLSGLIARDARLVTLAATLLANSDSDVSRVGEEALRALAGRYFPADDEGSSTGLELKRQLGLVADLDAPWILAVEANQKLEILVERLMRSGALPIALVIEPGTGARSERRNGEQAQPVIGPWDEVLFALASQNGVALEGHGLPRERSGGLARSAFVRVGTTGGSRGLAPADLALGWVRAAQAPEPRLRRQGLRALASSGWPAGLLLVEEAFAAGDRSAREALLLAAADGRRVARLFEADLLVDLLHDVAAELAAARGEGLTAALESARRLVAAYAGAGCVDRAGESLSQPLLAILRDAGARVGRPDVLLQWLTLSSMEGLRCGSEEVRLNLAALVENPDLDPALRLAALRTALAVGGQRQGAGELEGVPALWRELRAEARERAPGWRPPVADQVVTADVALAGLLVAFGVAPGAAQSRAQDAGWSRFVCAWQLAAGDVQGAAKSLRRVLAEAGDEAARRARGEELAAILARAVERGEAHAVVRVLSRARADAPGLGPSLDRVALLADVLEDRKRVAWVPVAPPDDLALLGALGGSAGIGAAGTGPRAQLLDLLEQALEAQRELDRVADLLGAHERVLAGLFASPSTGPSAGEAHAEDLRRLLRRRSRSSLAESLRRLRWPLPPRVRPTGPAASERVPPTRLLRE